ncbi:MAG: DNA-binding protein [candidate division WOR-3 bacterium]|nr:MAG: DNA-binding protein [candidate division WOR-3 bacterium]
MKIKRYENYVVIRLEKDEEIVTALKEALQRAGIEGGFFYGLGVGKNLQLGYFDAVEKNYTRKDFTGEYEFTNLSGNVSVADGQIMVHCHVTITDNEFQAFGGHLFEGLVPATLEIIVFPFSKPLTRSQDKTTGLNLLDL